MKNMVELVKRLNELKTERETYKSKVEQFKLINNVNDN